MNLLSILLYPVKSMRGFATTTADVEARGLRGDRRWMLVDANARFITARQHPRLLKFSAEPIRDGLVLFAPDRSVRDVGEPPPSAPTIEVGIWKSSSPARVADAEINDWLSQHVGIDVRLVHMADDCVRSVSRDWSKSGDIVSFADGFPLLLIGTASLDQLNAKLPRPVSMANFRPNLVVNTATAHVEDGWKRIAIGDVEFDVVKPCTRCVLTTIDPDDATPAADGEPLATLKTYRREAIGVTFGQNLIPRSLGTISADLPVRVLE
ncbi:MAG TPA: MOSC domain-containing protein [Pseudomonadota bacterium]|jgi:uncharacterized protein YcbX|nr:MOSC domain-containing protein [Pseudomonadota bacterium]